MAAGIVIEDKLYNGYNCGAGEFGTMPYMDHNYEYFASGSFFTNVHHVDGESVFKAARNEDPEALTMFKEFGTHLGNAIIAVLYALDPEIIILGGSVSKAYPFFKKSLWKSIQKMAYRTIPERLCIEVSSNPDIAVLGAAALYYNATSAQFRSRSTNIIHQGNNEDLN
jgi:glucokinase